MPNGEKKGITVRIDADLHAEVSQYLRDHSMTMAEFVSLALDDELHPKNQMKEGNTIQIITAPLLKSFDDKTDHRLLYRRLGVCANDVKEDSGVFQLNMFIDYI